jgi:thioredoxin reductase
MNHYDVTIIGAGVAGHSAALVLGRSRRSVLVPNGGSPRNAPSDASHGFFTRDNTSPLELLNIGVEQLTPYGVEVQSQNVKSIKKISTKFEAMLENSERITTRFIILATGVTDLLPEISGFSELWGTSVHHCPYCHGWEVRDLPVAVYEQADMGYHMAVMVRHWSKDLVLCSGGPAGLTPEQRQHLAQLQVTVIETPIQRLGIQDNRLESIIFSDGTTLKRDHIFTRPLQKQRADLAAQLGCDMTDGGVYVKVNGAGETSVPGVYAVGDMTDPRQAVSLAVASGANAAMMLNHALVFAEAQN